MGCDIARSVVLDPFRGRGGVAGHRPPVGHEFVSVTGHESRDPSPLRTRDLTRKLQESPVLDRDLRLEHDVDQVEVWWRMVVVIEQHLNAIDDRNDRQRDNAYFTARKKSKSQPSSACMTWSK